MERAVEAYSQLGVTHHGWMFQDWRGAPGGQNTEYEPELFVSIEAAINNESLRKCLILKSTIVSMEYGSGRSGRRGYAIHAANERGYFGEGCLEAREMEEYRESRRKIDQCVGGMKESY